MTLQEQLALTLIEKETWARQERRGVPASLASALRLLNEERAADGAAPMTIEEAFALAVNEQKAVLRDARRDRAEAVEKERQEVSRYADQRNAALAFGDAGKAAEFEALRAAAVERMTATQTSRLPGGDP